MLLRRLSRNHILPYRHPQKRSDISANASTRSLHHSASQQHPQADDSEMPSHHLRPIATKKNQPKFPTQLTQSPSHFSKPPCLQLTNPTPAECASRAKSPHSQTRWRRISNEPLYANTHARIPTPSCRTFSKLAEMYHARRGIHNPTPASSTNPPKRPRSRTRPWLISNRRSYGIKKVACV